jgi:hypothetical protein
MPDLERKITQQMTELPETPSLIIIFIDLTASKPTRCAAAEGDACLSRLNALHRNQPMLCL